MIKSRVDLRKEAALALNKKMSKIFLVYTTAAGFSALLAFLFIMAASATLTSSVLWIFGIIMLLVGLFAIGLIWIGVRYIFYDWAKNSEDSRWFSKLFICFKSNYCWNVIKLMVASAFFTYLWRIIFFPVGVAKALAYSQAFYILKERIESGQKITARECLKESARIMEGYKEDLYILEWSFIGWYCLSAMISFILILCLCIPIGMAALTLGSIGFVLMILLIVLALFAFYWVSGYAMVTTIKFYFNIKEIQGESTVTYYPDGSNLKDKGYSNSALTRINLSAAGIMLVGLIISVIAQYNLPSVSYAIGDNTYKVKITSTDSELDDKLYVHFMYDDDTYISHSAKSDADKEMWQEIEDEIDYDSTSISDELIKQGKTYSTPTGKNKIIFKQKNKKSMVFYDLKVKDHGEKITGKAKTVDGLEGKVSMTLE